MCNKTIDIEIVGKKFSEKKALCKQRIIICAGTGCVANGSLELYAKLNELMSEAGLDVIVSLKDEEPKNMKNPLWSTKSGCQGFCQMGPLLEVLPLGALYVSVTLNDLEEIVQKTILQGEVIERLLYKTPVEQKPCLGHHEIPFYTQQSRLILKQCGNIDPEDIEEYFSIGGYLAAKRVYTQMTPQEVCDEALLANLRGRGGGGFPAGRKWALTLKESADQKYVICNGDEGDPGAFMDRSLLEGAPHSVIEGMMIAAKAIGASKGYVYVRMEYPLAVKRMKIAVLQAREKGILGTNLFGTDLHFDLEIMEGAGAFVCGEETALMASIEGNRGMPKPKPPFPAQKGLFGKPTVINNVETLATVPYIFTHGAHVFKSLGTENSPGTKTFALTGHVANTGLIEVPFGTTLKKIILDIGGGVTGKKGEICSTAFKAVQIGGPSGGCLTKEHLDLPIDFENVTKTGAIVGSGGLVVMNQDTCMVKIARFFMEFTQEESCGKCILCREGTKQMLAILDDIIEGRGTMEQFELLKELANNVAKGSLCGLGKTAPNPVLSTIKYFEHEYLAHINEKRCPTKECGALSRPEIIEAKCVGCTLCARKCPVSAITGEKKKPHFIDPEKCINCKVCIDVCKLGAIA